MEHASQLRRNSSFSCVPLDIGHWCDSHRFSRHECFEDNHDQRQKSPISRERLLIVARWRELWRRILTEKRKIFNSATPVQIGYDEYTYAQNFDEGMAWVEPDNLSRSFSVRTLKGQDWRYLHSKVEIEYTP